MGDKPLCVAILDDDLGVGRALERLVRSLGHEAHAFSSVSALLYGMRPNSPTHVLLDLHMPDPGGPVLVTRVRTRWPEARVLVISGLETDGAAAACLAAGASFFLRKPFRSEELEHFLASFDHRTD